MGTSWALMSDRLGNHGLIIAKENVERAAKTASQNAMKSKAQAAKSRDQYRESGKAGCQPSL